jgi:hypothetical protein
MLCVRRTTKEPRQLEHASTRQVAHAAIDELPPLGRVLTIQWVAVEVDDGRDVVLHHAHPRRDTTATQKQLLLLKHPLQYLQYCTHTTPWGNQ